MNDVGPVYRWGVPVATALLITWLLVDCARGQSVEASAETGVMAWASDPYSYQHAMHARTDIVATWGRVVTRGKLGIKRWGASDAVLSHALLNAETGKVYSRRQGLGLGIQYDNFEVGAEYERRSVHHVWRHKGRKPRHDHFPGSWKIGRSGSAPSWDQNPIYPSLGYWGGIRPYIRVRYEKLRLVVRGPLVRWKTMTLPWPGVRANAQYKWGGWKVGFNVQGLRHRDFTGNINIQRHVLGSLWIQGKGGWAHPPQWKDKKLRRIAFGIVLK